MEGGRGVGGVELGGGGQREGAGGKEKEGRGRERRRRRSKGMEVRNGCEVREEGGKCGGVHSQYSPLCPGVRAASLEEYLFTCFSNTIPPKYTSKMAFLSGSVGRLTMICRSNLPGRNRAWSNTLSRLVDAKMTTPSEGVIPVIRVER